MVYIFIRCTLYKSHAHALRLDHLLIEDPVKNSVKAFFSFVDKIYTTTLYGWNYQGRRVYKTIQVPMSERNKKLYIEKK